MLDHHRLEVYGLVRRLRRAVADLTRDLPRGYGEILDQLNRAVLSIRLNIAEGSGEYSAKEKARFYRIARRSAAETSALLDELEDLDLITPEEAAPAQALVARIVGGLIRLIQATERRTPTPTPPRTPARKPASTPARTPQPTPTPRPMRNA